MATISLKKYLTSNMKLSEVNKLLGIEFNEALKSRGFKKSKYRFIKSIDDIYIKFLYSVIDSDISFPSHFSYGVGSHTVNNILKKILPKKYVEIPENAYSIALGTGQLKLYDQEKYPILEYDIHTLEDIRKMVNEVTDYLVNEVLPEWEANPTIFYLEKKVNGNLTDVPNFSGLILAKVVGNANYSRLKNHFSEISQKWSEWDRTDLKKVLDFLDSHDQKQLMQLGSFK